MDFIPQGAERIYIFSGSSASTGGGLGKPTSKEGILLQVNRSVQVEKGNPEPFSSERTETTDDLEIFMK